MLASAAAAPAAEPPPPDEREIQLDQSIQALKDEVVEFTRDAQSIEDDVLFPPQTRLDVYLGIKVSGLLMKQVTVSVDDRPAETHDYTDKDARALLADLNLERLLRANVNVGAHRVRVAFSGQFIDAKPDAAPVTDTYDAIFDKGVTPTELEFVVSRPTRFAKPRVSMKQWRAAR
jgi:hypothetical protein